MFNKRCPACANKINRNFNYCPHCGASFKANKEKENFGMLGRDDSNERIQNEVKLPLGIDKVMNSLVKQLEKQIGNMDINNNPEFPKGIKIQIARGTPQMKQVVREMPEKKENVVLTELATGLEIRAYSKDKCYVKFIPLKVEVIEYYIEKEKIIIEFKG